MRCGGHRKTREVDYEAMIEIEGYKRCLLYEFQ